MVFEQEREDEEEVEGEGEGKVRGKCEWDITLLINIFVLFQTKREREDEKNREKQIDFAQSCCVSVVHICMEARVTRVYYYTVFPFKILSIIFTWVCLIFVSLVVDVRRISSWWLEFGLGNMLTWHLKDRCISCFFFLAFLLDWLCDESQPLGPTHMFLAQAQPVLFSNFLSVTLDAAQNKEFSSATENLIMGIEISACIWRCFLIMGLGLLFANPNYVNTDNKIK